MRILIEEVANPDYHTGTSSVVAAKLVRECLIAIGRKVKEVNHAGGQGVA
jgi:hypothetical protein